MGAVDNSDVGSLAGKIRRCTLCERCETRHFAVPGCGVAGSRLLLLGEAPGKQEDLKGVPFAGRAGAYLDRVLGSMGIGRDVLFITSILKCYHPKAPHRHQIEACLPWSIAQINAVGPEVILVMGLTAAAGLLGVKSLGQGELTTTLRGFDCVVTCHPASAMRFPQRNLQFRRDMDRALRLARLL